MRCKAHGQDQLVVRIIALLLSVPGGPWGDCEMPQPWGVWDQDQLVVRMMSPLGGRLLRVKSRSIADDQEHGVCNCEMSGISGTHLRPCAKSESACTLCHVRRAGSTSLSSGILTFSSRCRENPGH